MDAQSGIWTADLGNGNYRNPILHADYSDPDAICVGSDFFMTASSFASLPGLPILHSKDLVNWKLAGHALPRLDWPGYDLPAHGKGVWAPSIRWRDGFFYIYFASPDEGVFMVRTDDPFGAWSKPVCVKRTIGWIDPCPFWDDDGRAYLVNAFANSRVGFKSVLRLNRMTEDGTEILSEGRFIFDGQDRHITMEGPKMYKRNGLYYIFAPAGGVKHGWQTVLRSPSLFGPYEDRIALHQGTSDVNGPHQGAWVETEKGESWFLHFQDKGAYGRIVHLQPMSWNFDWPIIGIDVNNDGIGEPVAGSRKPDVGGTYAKDEPATSDDFRSPDLGKQWQWQADQQSGRHEIKSDEGVLRLFGIPLPEVAAANLLDAPNVLSQKFPAPAFRAETRVRLRPAGAGDSAGLVVLGDDYRGIELRAGTDGGFDIVLVEGSARWDGRSNAIPEKKNRAETILAHTEDDDILLGVAVEEGAVCSLYCRGKNGAEAAAGEAFKARPGLWVGTKIGIYCLSAGGKGSPHADFSGFTVGRA